MSGTTAKEQEARRGTLAGALLVVAALTLWSGAARSEALTQQAALHLKADKVVVLKGERRLMLMRDGVVLEAFRIALGGQPLGRKTRRGDGRTPEGRYVIDWRNPESRFYRSLHISYPNDRDRAAAAAAGVPPGGDIMIHGLPNGLQDIGKAHAEFDWTEGCIAVSNEEMDSLWNGIDDGTPIEIRP